MSQVKPSECHSGVGSRIRRLRLRTGLSQEKFAPLIGITRRHLIRLEKGENRPSAKLADRIEQVVQEHTCKPVPFHVLEDVVPPFRPANPDMRAELFDALRQIIREELASTLRSVAA